MFTDKLQNELIKESSLLKATPVDEQAEKTIDAVATDFIERLVDIGNPEVQRRIIINVQKGLINLYQQRINESHSKLEAAQSNLSIFVD